MKELNNLEKQRIGKSFKYYRKKKNIQWKEIEKICSPATYSKLEKGNITKNSTIYDDLFELLNIKYDAKPNFDSWLIAYLLKLNDILEYYKEDEFDSLFEELEKELGSYKHIIIYEQYYQVITYILNYYKYSKYMTLEEIKECFNLFESFDFEETIMIYLLETMFISNNNLLNNNELIEKTYLLSLSYQEYPIIWYIQAGYFKIQAMFETSLEYFTKSFNYYTNLENKYRVTKALMGKYIIYKNIDPKKAKETEELLMQLKKDKKLYISMIPVINFNIGMNYYLKNNYEKAYDLFLDNITTYRRNREWIYVCAICTQLDIPIPKELENYNIQEIENPILMKYFYMKYHNYPNKKLVEYIMKTITPQCLIYEKYRQPYWAIFEEELFYFSKKDKRFTDTFLEFLNLEKKACKKY